VLARIVDELFTQHGVVEEISHGVQEADMGFTDITIEELTEAVKGLSVNKAPGPDGIPNVVLKVLVQKYPEVFRNTFQELMKQCVFPDQWKRQKLVLLPKPIKAPGDPPSYRPICLLDTLGKLLEKIIQKRLTKHTESDEVLSNRQFGFRKGRSTLDAILTVKATALKAQTKKKGGNRFCAITTIDVKNAFNSASWSAIKKALQAKGVSRHLCKMIGSYLSNRVLLYETQEGLKERKVTAGVPQGSILGPLLWNIMYDGVLRLKLPVGVEIVGFSDDIVILITGDSKEHIEMLALMAIDIIQKWMEENMLQIAHHKTEMLVVTNCKQAVTAHLELDVSTIESKRQLKYLGVMVDDRLNFNSHIDYACERAAKAQAALARIMPNKAGPRSSKRKLLANVSTSILRYGGEAWVEFTHKKRNTIKLNSVYRLSAIRVASAYRTISYDAVCVIAGMLPICILLKEDSKCWASKKEKAISERPKHREESLKAWQEDWDNSQKGRWTYRLIPSIKEWLNRPHGEVNFHLTEFLSGHGGFGEYLYRIKRIATPYCNTCVQVIESPEHVLLKCPRFNIERQEMFKHLDPSTDVSNIIKRMCHKESVWNAVNEAIAKIMVKLEELRSTS
jgi:hypothetical protein